MSEQPTWHVNVSADLPVAREVLGTFAEQVNHFIETRQMNFFDRVKARMPGVSGEQVERMFSSAEQALAKIAPQLEGKNASQRDALQIDELAKVFASNELAYTARQYYKLGKLKAALPQLQEQFDAQLAQLVTGRTLSHEARSVASAVTQALALDEVKTLYPEREGTRDMDLYRDTSRLTRELTVLLTDNAGVRSGPAMLDIDAFRTGFLSQARELAGLSSTQQQRA